MTLDEAKELLKEKNISFSLCEFENEREYWQHTTLFPYTKNAKPCKVIALCIQSRNGHKNIELQFNRVEDTFVFEELRFGDYCYEMFDCNLEMLADRLIHNITEIIKGKLTIIVSNDLDKKRWLGDACFDRDDDDKSFGEPGFQKAMQRIKKPKSFLSKLLGTKKQYEIFSWNNYQCIVE